MEPRWPAVGERVVLCGLQKDEYNRHVAVVTESPARKNAQRCAVNVAGTSASILVRPERCLPDDGGGRGRLVGGLDAAFVIWVLQKTAPDTFLREVLEIVIHHLHIAAVDMAHVQAVAASSEMHSTPYHRYTFKKECSLEEGTDSCWISNCDAPQWLVYSLGPQPCRVSYVSMSIPTLPGGPLSVRRFRLESSHSAAGPWREAEDRASFVTLDEEGLQQFALQTPLEAAFLRLVCIENATATRSQIGFWQVAFA